MSANFCIEGCKFSAPALLPALYVVATPIGNLRDISVRALQTLASASVIYCEDTRTSRKLLQHYSIVTHTLSYHDHNGAQRRPEILERLSKGEPIALISDAGTPLISDPGYKLVRDVRAAGFAVISIPGACAAISAIACSGLPSDSFTFLGFLPNKTAARQDKILPYLEWPSTLVLYESASRIGDLLRDLVPLCGKREICLARELTKLHETIYTGTIESLYEQLKDINLKGELVVLIAPATEYENRNESENAETLLREHLKTLSLKLAAQLVAQHTGLKKTDIYAMGLKLKQ